MATGYLWRAWNSIIKALDIEYPKWAAVQLSDEPINATSVRIPSLDNGDLYVTLYPKAALDNLKISKILAGLNVSQAFAQYGVYLPQIIPERTMQTIFSGIYAPTELGCGIIMLGQEYAYALDSEHQQGNLTDNVLAELKELGVNAVDKGIQTWEDLTKYVKSDLHPELVEQMSRELNQQYDTYDNDTTKKRKFTTSEWAALRFHILGKWLSNQYMSYGFVTKEGELIDLDTYDQTTFQTRLNTLLSPNTVTLTQQQANYILKSGYTRYIHVFELYGTNGITVCIITTAVPVASWQVDYLYYKFTNDPEDVKYINGFNVYLYDDNGNNIHNDGSSFGYSYRMFYPYDRAHLKLYHNTAEQGGNAITIDSNIRFTRQTDVNNSHYDEYYYGVTCYPEATTTAWEYADDGVTRYRQTYGLISGRYTWYQTLSGGQWVDDYHEGGAEAAYIVFAIKNNTNADNLSRPKKNVTPPDYKDPIDRRVFRPVGPGNTPVQIVRPNSPIYINIDPDNITYNITNIDEPTNDPDNDPDPIPDQPTTPINIDLNIEITPDPNPRSTDDVIDDYDREQTEEDPIHNPEYTPNVVPPLADSDMITIYNISSANLSTLASYLWSNIVSLETVQKMFSNPIDSIISLAKPGCYIDTPNQLSEIKFGGTAWTGAQGKKINNLIQEVSLGSAYIPTAKGYPTFLDFSPYTKINLFLPFIGFVDLSPEEVVGSTITIKYQIEVLTGSCLAQIWVKNAYGNSIRYQFSGNTFMPLPITGNNYSSLYGNVIGATVSTIAGAIATGGVGAAVGAIGGVGNIMTDSKIEVSKGNGLQGVSGFLTNRQSYITIERPIVTGYNDSFLSLTGQRTCFTSKISGLSGFVQVESCMLNDMNATRGELEEIEALLKEGIYV